jgi:hypothetical protein
MIYFPLLISLTTLADAFNVTLKVGVPAFLFYADSEILMSRSSVYRGHFRFLKVSGRHEDDETPVSSIYAEKDPEAFTYILHFLNTGRLPIKDVVEPASLFGFEYILHCLRTVRLPYRNQVEKAPLIEILQESEYFHLDPLFYDEVVKHLSLQDYKNVVESLRTAGNEPAAISIQRSLASAFVEYSRLWLEEDMKRELDEGGASREEAILDTPLLQGLLAEYILKSKGPLTESLVIPGWEHEDESQENSPTLIELVSCFRLSLDSPDKILEAIERDLTGYDDILEGYVTAGNDRHVKRIERSRYNRVLKLSPKAMAIILKRSKILDRGRLLYFNLRQREVLTRWIEVIYSWFPLGTRKRRGGSMDE